jgi:zinc/manganese transport system substrate-binding protein
MTRCSSLLCIVLTIADPSAANAGLRVVATVPDLAAIARAVGGDRAAVESLTLPTQDPHFVDARPHLALALNRAHLLLVVGLGLEAGWLPVLLSGARNAAIQAGAAGHLDCSTVVRLKEVPTVRLDRSMGDIHPGGNPHYLLDPENAIRVARAVAGRMSALDSSGRAAYEANAKKLVAAVEEARRRWAAALRPYAGTAVVAYHRSWIYFADAMGLKIAMHLEPRPGIPPSAAHVLLVIRTMTQKRVPVMLQEDYYPDRTGRLVAQRTGASLLILRGGTHLGRGETYVKRVDAMVQSVVSALQRRRPRG